MKSFTLPFDISDLSSQLNPLLHSLGIAPVIDNLKPSTTADALAALLFLLASLGYLTRGRIWDKPDPYHYVSEAVSYAIYAPDFHV